LSATLLPLTLITGFYGMNIDSLPLAQNGVLSVLFLVGMMVVVCGALLWFFKRNKWL
jgi:Mg2+ and Co2+ transporter CorA